MAVTLLTITANATDAEGKTAVATITVPVVSQEGSAQARAHPGSTSLGAPAAERRGPARIMHALVTGQKNTSTKSGAVPAVEQPPSASQAQRSQLLFKFTGGFR